MATVRDVHPIERLRYVARAGDVPATMLARETAFALADFVGDDAMLQIACQRIIARQPTAGALVWLVAHVLGSPNQRQALWNAVEQLEDDDPATALASALPDGARIATVGWPVAGEELLRRRGDLELFVVVRSSEDDFNVDRARDDGHQIADVALDGLAQAVIEADMVLLDTSAIGPRNALVPTGSLAAAAVASHLDRPVWVQAPTGAALPERLYDGVVARWNESDRDPMWERPIEELGAEFIAQVVAPSGLFDVVQAVAASQCPIVPELY